MFELFAFLDKHRTEIVQDLLERLPKTVSAYQKIPRPELKESLEHLIESFGDYIVTGEPDTLTSVLKYITKLRAQQSFKLSDVLRGLQLLPTTLRLKLEEEYLKSPNDKNIAQYQEAVQKYEDAANNAMALFVDIFQEYLFNMLNEHQDYLKKTNQKYGIDLSKFILFKG